MNFFKVNYQKAQAKLFPRVCGACAAGGKTTQRRNGPGTTCDKCGTYREAPDFTRPFNPWGDWDTSENQAPDGYYT